MSTSINDINSTEEVELQMITQSIVNNILDRVFDSSSSISNHVEKIYCTGDDPKFGSLKNPEKDEPRLKGTDDRCTRPFKAQNSNSKISNQIEKSHSTGEDSKSGSWKDPEKDEPCLKGIDIQYL